MTDERAMAAGDQSKTDASAFNDNESRDLKERTRVLTFDHHHGAVKSQAVQQNQMQRNGRCGEVSQWR